MIDSLFLRWKTNNDKAMKVNLSFFRIWTFPICLTFNIRTDDESCRPATSVQQIWRRFSNDRNVFFLFQPTENRPAATSSANSPELCATGPMARGSAHRRPAELRNDSIRSSIFETETDDFFHKFVFHFDKKKVHPSYPVENPAPTVQVRRRRKTTFSFVNLFSWRRHVFAFRE